MKKIISLSLLFLFSLVLTAHADVIPENMHAIDRCAKFVNLDKYPNITLTASYSGPMVQGETYTVENNKCLTKGYKFNTLHIYWGTNDGQPAPAETHKIIDIEPYGGLVVDTDPIVKETIEYSIAGIVDGKLVVYKSKQTSSYNNGKADKIETFKSPITAEKTTVKTKDSTQTSQVVQPMPETRVEATVKIGFWQRLMCFFGLSKQC